MLTAKLSLTQDASPEVAVSPSIDDATDEARILDFIWFNYTPRGANGVALTRNNANMATAVRDWETAVLEAELRKIVSWHRSREEVVARGNVKDFSGAARA